MLLFALALVGTSAAIQELPAARAALDATGFSGTILVHDLARGTFRAGHVERVDRRLIPASTFKIFSSLVALETGVIADAHTIIPWDGTVRERSALNRDLDLAEAFRVSALPHYQELARRIGAERMQRYLDAVGYGNRDSSGGLDRFWLDGGLRISPREQVEFLARLYRGDLPFSERAQQLVRELMAVGQTTPHTVRAKTGWARLPGGKNVGWWVGWVERDGGAVVFATVLEARAPDKTFGPARQAVTRTVLGLDEARATHPPVIYLVRHTERAEDGTTDPPLRAAGIARAETLAAMLRDAGLTAIHTTDFQRTRSTAAPIAERTGLQPTLYDTRDLASFAERLRASGGRHLIVGHSDTTPALVRALGGVAGEPIDDSEYDRLYVITFGAAGAVTVLLRF